MELSEWKVELETLPDDLLDVDGMMKHQSADSLTEEGAVAWSKVSI